MTVSVQWQLARESAERYQNILTPAILGPFAGALVNFAVPQSGESVLDVGTGTGAAARAVAHRVGPSGRVDAVDVNESMLAVARTLPRVPGAPIAWRQADAAQLPLVDRSVDLVLCAQTLQFLPDRQTSLREMRRVLKDSGRIALSLWCDITENPYFDALTTAIATNITPQTAAGLQSAFSLTALEEIYALFATIGTTRIESKILSLNLPFADLLAFVPRHISATPMATAFNQAAPHLRQTVIAEVVEHMSRYRQNGRLEIPFRSHLVMAWFQSGG